jgi:methylenetetrahydrofolate--tRNA-(uracil-5-)-methyltransferase
MGMANGTVAVVGGGLAGSEAAWQLAERGYRVVLYEMRPVRSTPAHRTELLGELVCSNTFKSTDITNAHGLLKAEMRVLGSVVLWAAEQARVPGGTALAVDRELFARALTERVSSHPRIELVREEVVDLPSPGIVATGPLTSDALAGVIQDRVGSKALAFYDAVAPIVAYDSLDLGIVFPGSRYGKESMEGASSSEGYLNCPMGRDDYERFVDALLSADRYPGHEFERIPYFEGCMPIEVMAERGRETLRFGPMKPVGLRDPRTGRRPWAVVQLRREDRAGRMWNMVGFQTRLRTREQVRVFRMIPGLGEAEFLRYGAIHRNSYLNAPAVLSPHLSLRDAPLTLFAGQLTGVEGYTESAATGLVGGILLARMLGGEEPVLPPPVTMIGALYRYLREADPANFQPMNANFGLLDELAEDVSDRRLRKQYLAERAIGAILEWRERYAALPREVGA